MFLSKLLIFFHQHNTLSSSVEPFSLQIRGKTNEIRKIAHRILSCIQCAINSIFTIVLIMEHVDAILQCNFLLDVLLTVHCPYQSADRIESAIRCQQSESRTYVADKEAYIPRMSKGKSTVFQNIMVIFWLERSILQFAQSATSCIGVESQCQR